MKEPLDDFIRANRSAFDDRDPSPQLWSRIAKASEGQRRPDSRWLPYWRAAAVFFMMLSASLFLYQNRSSVSQAEAIKEFSDVEAFYHHEINHKVKLIGEFQGNSAVNGFTSDFQQLEAMYLVLREEMRQRPSKHVRDALVLNLLVRIDLLNKHLERLETEQETEQKSDDRST